MSQTVKPQTLSITPPATSAAARPAHRAVLCNVLEDQNRRWEATTATMTNLERLRALETVAIVSGQQAGLFGGPALIAWKILTTIYLATRLQAQGISAVPVFWIASEDHDFDEVCQTTVLAGDGSLCTIACRPTLTGRPSVGAIRLDATVSAAVDRLAQALPRSEFTPDLLARLNDCYRPGRYWCDAFAMWLHDLFAPFGLIILDPRDVRLRVLARPVFESFTAIMPSVMEKLRQQVRAWHSAGKVPQVNVHENSTLLFLDTNHHRTPLLADGQYFYPKSDPGTRYTVQDLLSILQDTPLRLTPSALLRPVIQDWLLPTVIHVVGPAEAAYLEQSQLIYEALQIAPPLRRWRPSVTITEKRHVRLLTKLSLRLEDIFLGRQEIMHRAAILSADRETLDTFGYVRTTISSRLDDLHRVLQVSDPSLADALRRSREKMLHHIQGLEQKFLHNQAQRQEALIRQIDRATNALAPYGKPQERVLNLLSFVAKYGKDLVRHCYEQIDFDGGEHQWLPPESELAR